MTCVSLECVDNTSPFLICDYTIHKGDVYVTHNNCLLSITGSEQHTVRAGHFYFNSEILELIVSSIVWHTVVEVDSHSSTSTCGPVSSLEVVAVDSHISVTVSCLKPCFCDAQYVSLTLGDSHFQSQFIYLWIHTAGVPLNKP